MFQNNKNGSDPVSNTLFRYDDATKEKLTDALVLLIEVELKKQSAAWSDAIKSPYKRSHEESLICDSHCPIPMMWSEWSCHCKEQVLNKY